MKIQIFRSNIELDIISKKYKEAQALDLKIRSELLKRDLVEATPIDTGLAKASWEVTAINEETLQIKNDVPYIGLLNHGSSKQAPSHFIEMVALKHGKPVGTILTET